jgi:hypothetical protein
MSLVYIFFTVQQISGNRYGSKHHLRELASIYIVAQFRQCALVVVAPPIITGILYFFI